MQSQKARKKDRPLYVPPQARSERKDNSALQQVELVGRFGRIGGYEFEYKTKEEADLMASILQKRNFPLEGGLTYHYKPSNLNENAANRSSDPLCTMKADIYEDSLETEQRIINKHISDGMALMDSGSMSCSWKKEFAVGPNDKRNVPKKHAASDGAVESEPVQKLKPPVRKKSEDTFKKSATTVYKKPSVETYLPSIVSLYPSAASRRLLSACWISVFCLAIKNKENINNKFYDDAINVFQNIKNFAENHNSKEATHFRCHSNIILGDALRYYYKHVCDSDENCHKPDIFSAANYYYKQAQNLFPQEGHLYSQWANLATIDEDYLAQLVYIVRSCVSSFSCKNKDVLTVLLAQKALKDDSAQHDVCDVILKQLDQFDKELNQFAETIKSNANILGSVKMQASYEKIVLLLILAMVETSGVWQNQQVIACKLTKLVNSIKFEVELNEFNTPQYVLSDPEEFITINNEIKSLYNQLRHTFYEEFQNPKLDLIQLICSNEQFKFSCLFLCQIVTSFLDEATQSPVSPLWCCIQPLLLWMAYSKLLYVEQECSILSYVQKIQNQIFNCVQSFSLEDNFSKCSSALLQYKCDEDAWTHGVIPWPLRFIVSKESKDLTNCSYTSIISSTKTSKRNRCSSEPAKSRSIFQFNHHPLIDTKMEEASYKVDPSNGIQFISATEECTISEASHVRFCRLVILSTTLKKLRPSIDEKEETRLVEQKIERSNRGGKIHLKVPIDVLTSMNPPVSRRGFRSSKKASMQNSSIERFIVIDGHSLGFWKSDRDSGKEFDANYVEIALNYYRAQNFKCIIILSDYIAKNNPNESLKILQRLEDYITTIPTQDSIWDYMILLAKKNNGCVLSNYPPPKERLKRDIARWLKTHVISYTFVENEIIPNPDFKYPGNTMVSSINTEINE